jgi:hypothetical protein
MPGIAVCIPLSLLLSFYLSRQAGVLAAPSFSLVEGFSLVVVLTTVRPLSQIVKSFIMRWLLFPTAVLLVAGSAAASLHLDSTKRKEQNLFAVNTALYTAVYLRHVEEDLVYLLASLESSGDPAGQLKEFKAAKPLYQRILLMDGEGIVRASMPEGDEKLDFSGLLPRPMQAKKTYYTRPYYNQKRGAVAIGAVRSSPSDRMVLVELDLQVLENYLNEVSLREGGNYAFITDSFGNILAHPDRTFVERHVNMGNL